MAGEQSHPGGAHIRAGIAEIIGGLLAVDSRLRGNERSEGDPSSGRDAAGDSKDDRRRRSWDELTPTEKRAMLDTNDKGMAERLAHYSKGKLIFTSQTGWLVWDGRRFLGEDGLALARREVMKMIGRIKREEYKAIRDAGLNDQEEMMADVDSREAHKAFIKRINRLWAAAVTLGNNTKQKSVLEVAAAMGEFLARFDDLDADPGRLNTASGLINLPIDKPVLREGDSPDTIAFEAMAAITARKAVTGDKVTRVTAAALDLAAMRADDDIHPVWSAHLAKIMPDRALRKTLQRVLGSMLVSHNPQNNWFLFRGPGGDGKSTTIRAVQHAIGDYALTGDVKTFLYDSRASASGPRQDLMRLAGGNRMVILPEPEQGDLLAAGEIKKVTGGDEVSTRESYGKQTEFKAMFKMIMMCNPRPRVKGDDDAFWRRTIEIPFRVQIAPAERDPGIDHKLAAEADGILLWLLEGYFDWWSRGFDYDVAPAALNATNAYRREASPLAAWMQDRIHWGRWFDRDRIHKEGGAAKTAWLRAKDGDADAAALITREFLKTAEANSTPPPEYSPAQIYEDFEVWCEMNGLDAWQKNAFTKQWSSRAVDRGCVKGRTGSKGRFWTGFDFTTGRARMKGEMDARDEGGSAGEIGF